LDMLKRLSSHDPQVNNQIVEVLLTTSQFLPALRFIKSHRGVKYSVSRFLEAALTEGDQTLFYTVFTFFEKRGELTDECGPFVRAFNALFQA